jgi:hypothetical protein
LRESSSFIIQPLSVGGLSTRIPPPKGFPEPKPESGVFGWPGNFNGFYRTCASRPTVGSGRRRGGRCRPPRMSRVSPASEMNSGPSFLELPSFHRDRRRASLYPRLRASPSNRDRLRSPGATADETRPVASRIGDIPGDIPGEKLLADGAAHAIVWALRIDSNILNGPGWWNRLRLRDRVLTP